MTDNLPQWFKRTPIFAAYLTKQRADDEAKRRTIAAQRDALIAAERRDAPKRQKAIDAATAKLRDAEAALVQARAAHAATVAPLHADGATRGHTIDRLTGDLRRLASPSIGDALITIADREDEVRRSKAPTTARDLAALRTARAEITALYERTDVDADAEIRRILNAVPTGTMVAA